jgi:signal transduction histidine kinase
VNKLASKLDVVSHQVDRLTTLIDNLLDVTRITSGRMTLSPEPFDLADAVRSVIGRSKELLTRSGSELSVSVESPAVGQWDRLRIEVVILNLLSNAIKYGQGKPIEVTIAAAGACALLRVVDHGIGIAPAEQRRIFERFERAVPEHHYGGFGLGLWVARKIVEAHGGAIEVESIPSTGSHFVVSLPREPSA